MIGRFLTAYIATLPNVVTMLNGSSGLRLAPQSELQDAARPLVTYEQISGNRFSALDGPSGIAEPRVQLTIVADTYSEAKLLAREIAGTRGDERLDGFRGEMGGVNVRQCRLEDERDSYNLPAGGRGLGTCEVQQDYMIAFDESNVVL